MICYILYSSSLDRYYIGSSNHAISTRLDWHNGHKYGGKSFTSRANDWVSYHVIDCISMEQAKAIEMHIKSMKSTRYIENMKKYPEISERLESKYK